MNPYTTIGENVWEQCNQVFDRLSLSAIIDRDIFCCHGGIPRPVQGFDSELEAIYGTCVYVLYDVYVYCICELILYTFV